MSFLLRSLLCTLTVTASFLSPCCGAEHDQRLTWILGDQIEVGVLLAGAGRVVVLQQPQGQNVLASRPDLWTAGALPEPTINTWIDVGGHMTWVSPQSAWWNQQNLVERPNAVWPPDPWGLIAPATIEAEAVGSLTVTGTASPVSGLQMTKHYVIEGDTLIVTTTATNIRDSAVTWGLWSNLHPLATADAFVPLGEKGSIEVRHTSWQPAATATLPYQVVHGMLAFPAIGSDPTKQSQAKFYCHNTLPHMAAVSENWCLVVSPEPVASKDIAPGQAALEIYRDIPITGTALLELEHHGRYVIIQAGDSLTMTERWRLVPYAGGATIEDRAAFVAELLTPKH